MFQLLIMKLDCLNKCKLAQDSMKCKTCETPCTSVDLRTFSVTRSQIPRILKTCIAKVLKFSQDLVFGEITFPHLRKKGRLKNTVGRRCTHIYSSRRWALTALSLHLMMSLFTRWGKVLWGWVSLIPSSPRWFRMWHHLSTYRENSPRMTIGTPRLTRLARTCLGRRLGPQYLKNYTLFYQKAMQLIWYYNPGQNYRDTNTIARQIEASSLPPSQSVRCWRYVFKF